MSYGLEQYGIGSWGGSDFVVNNHIPSDLSTGINRLPIIGCILFSQSGNVVLASINLSVNGIALITNGVFTSSATGTIDATNPAAVQLTTQVLHEFAPLELVTVTVSALNTSNQAPTSGTTWQFNVDNTIHTFQTHIVRKFERVFNAQASGLSAPTNSNATVILTPPNLTGTVV